MQQNKTPEAPLCSKHDNVEQGIVLIKEIHAYLLGGDEKPGIFERLRKTEFILKWLTVLCAFLLVSDIKRLIGFIEWIINKII